MSVAGDTRQRAAGQRAAVSSATSDRHTWWRRIDPLVYVIGVTALIVYSLHGFDGFLQRDPAIYAYGGQQVVEGVPPYVGLLNRAGPLAHLIPAIGVAVARAVGFEDLLGMRLLFMIIAVACVCAVYALARELFASRLAGLVAAAAFLSFHGFIKLATYGPREKTPMVFFLVCALLAVAKRWWFVAGFSLSLATLVWQPAFFVGLTAAISTVIALRASERLQALIRFVVGGLVPASVCVIYFAVAGALKEFIDAFLLINARYTIAAPLLTDFAKKWSRTQGAYGVSLWVMGVGLAALAILTFLAIRRGGWRAPARIPVAAVGAAFFAAIAWSFRDFNSWPDAFLFLPFAAVGIGGIAKELTERLPARAALLLCLTSVVAAVAVAATYSTTHRGQALELQRASVAAMLEQLPSDVSIQSIGAPEPLVLSRSTNLTRHQIFVDGLDQYINDTWPGGLRGFARWVGREEPTIVSMNRNRVPRWLRATIKREYRWAGQAGWTWYVHRSVGPVVPTDPVGG
jgi:hypothetical protein